MIPIYPLINASFSTADFTQFIWPLTDGRSLNIREKMRVKLCVKLNSTLDVVE
jgi:hypothetical protein